MTTVRMGHQLNGGQKSPPIFRRRASLSDRGRRHRQSCRLQRWYIFQEANTQQWVNTDGPWMMMITSLNLKPILETTIGY